jgi:hypothetical protein
MRKYWKMVFPTLTILATAFGVLYGKQDGVDSMFLLIAGAIGVFVAVTQVTDLLDRDGDCQSGREK